MGFAAAGAIYGGWNWGRGDVDINVNRATNIDRNFTQNNVNMGNKWQHNPQHRGNVGYRDPASRERYASQRPAAADRGEYRGRDGERGTRDNLGGERAAHRDTSPGERGGDRADRGGQRDGLPSHGDFDRGSQRNNAFEGVGNGNRDLDRGRASTSQMQRTGGHNLGGGGSYQRPSGGSSRNFSGSGGGGGARAGGGGGRGGRR